MNQTQIDMSDLIGSQGFDAEHITATDVAHCRRYVDAIEGVRSSVGRVVDRNGEPKVLKAQPGSFYAHKGEAAVTVVLTNGLPRVYFGTECEFQVELERDRLPYETTLENQLDWVAHDVVAKVEELNQRSQLLLEVAMVVARWWDARRSLRILQGTAP